MYACHGSSVTGAERPLVVAVAPRCSLVACEPERVKSIYTDKHPLDRNAECIGCTTLDVFTGHDTLETQRLGSVQHKQSQQREVGPWVKQLCVLTSRCS